MHVFENSYAEELNSKNIPLIGMALWYYVSDKAQVDCNDFKAKIEELDAPMNAPKAPKPGDIFRRACTAAKQEKIRASSGTYFNYSLKDAGYDATHVFQGLVREEVDAKAHMLSYVVLGTVEFDKASAEVVFREHTTDREGHDIDPIHDPMSMSIIEDIQTYVDERVTILSPIAVRESIRRSIEDRLSGIPCKPGGGLFFVPIEKALGLQAMQSVVNEFEGISTHPIPLIDDEKQRESIREAFYAESVIETDKLMVDLHALTKLDSVPATKFTDVKVRYDALKEKLEEYQAVLGDALDEARVTMEIAHGQIINILKKAQE